MVIYCPFCGASLNCPEPPPERAACYRCRAEFSPAVLLRTAKPPAAAAATAAGTASVPAGPGEVRVGQAFPEREALAAESQKRAGIALIIAGVLALLTSPFNGIAAAYAFAGARVGIERAASELPEIDPAQMEAIIKKRLHPGLMLAFGIGYVFCGLLIAAGGVAAVANYSPSLTRLAVVLCFVPSCTCCILTLPAGIYAALELSRA